MYAVELESFAPGNPFHHDSLNVGIRLEDALLGSSKENTFKGVYIMGAAFRDDYDFYIVDSKTGERIGIKLDAKTDSETVNQCLA